jgi:hypothetical protein
VKGIPQSVHKTPSQAPNNWKALRFQPIREDTECGILAQVAARPLFTKWNLLSFFGGKSSIDANGVLQAFGRERPKIWKVKAACSVSSEVDADERKDGRIALDWDRAAVCRESIAAAISINREDGIPNDTGAGEFESVAAQVSDSVCLAQLPG